MNESKQLLKKLGVLIAASIFVAVLWFSGLEMVYARVLVFSTNMVIGISGSDTEIQLDEQNNTKYFRVFNTRNGQRGTFLQKFGSLLIPAVMIFAWQIFSAFYLKPKRALRSAGINFGIFVAFQVFFLLLLTGFHTSTTARFIYELFLDSFYIVALAIILVDNFRNPIFLTFLQTEKARLSS
jgi:hypothetical protein